jgi:hypothetical protein
MAYLTTAWERAMNVTRSDAAGGERPTALVSSGRDSGDQPAGAPTMAGAVRAARV